MIRTKEIWASLPKELRDLPWHLPTECFIPNAPSWREMITAEPDFPHQDFHPEQVAKFALVLAQVAGCSETEVKLAFAAGFLHDEGYRFVGPGFLTGEEHYLGSWLRVMKTYEDEFSVVNLEAVAKAVFLHTEDVLPAKTPLWTKAVRDADRIAGMGPTGFIREAYYCGFRHPAFEGKTSEALVREGIVCDLRWPWVEDHDEKPMQFCRQEVIPWVVENGQTLIMLKKANAWITRFKGQLGEAGSWEVEPVMSEAQELFYGHLGRTLDLGLELGVGFAESKGIRLSIDDL